MLQGNRVHRLVRFGATLVIASFAWHGRAQTSPPPLDTVAPTPGAEEVEPLRAWDVTGNFRTSFGYKENVLLSAVRSENSTFAQAEGELFWWRMPTERFEAMAFGNTALTRFFQSTENPREWQAFAHGEARWFLPANFQTTAVAEAYHLDQIFDLSATTAEHLVARLAVTGALASAAFRWETPTGTWVELKPALQRDRYRDGSDDNAQQLLRAAAGHPFLAGRVEVSLAAQGMRRTYDFRPQYTAFGRPLLGSELVFEQREGELVVDVTWDQAGRWKTVTSGGLLINEDNGSGFFDYEHRYLRQEITWTRASWKIRLIGRAGRYDYDVQTVGIGINPPKRRKDEHLAQVRLERQWNENVRLYFDYVGERSRSNDPLANYRVNTVSAGADWAF